MSNNFKIKHGLEVANGATISAGGLTVTGATTVNADLHVSGDITYNGQATVIQSTPIAVDQPMIHLADGNTADTLDQGVIGKYSTTKYSGLVRDASDAGTWKLFSNLLTTPGNAVDFSAVTYDHLKIGALDATSGAFSAGVSGTTGTFSGALSATTGSFGSTVTAPNFVSTATTGTAPFTVTSATPVAGLNIGGYSSALKTATGSVSVSSATAPTAGQVLTATNGTTATWETPATTGVTSVAGAGTVNGLTLSGTVTSTGNLTLGGTLSGVNLTSAVTGVLPVSNGGTGVGTSTGTGSVVLSTSPAITTSLTTPSTSFDLVNTTATTVNVAGDATTLRLGAGSGTTFINNNLQVAGTITYNGTANQLSPTNLSVSDALIYMADGNIADTIDIGILGHYSNTKYTGLVRDASDVSWKLFSNISTTPGATVDFTGASYDSLYVGNLHSNQVISSVATGTAPLVVTSATPVSGLNIDGYSTALKTASGSVSIGSAIAPTAGQVLTAINGTSAQWTTLTAGASDLSNVTGVLAVANGGTGVGTSTGTGSVVLSTSPTLVTPILGAASATTVNKLTLTQPASGATLTLSDGSSLITSGANNLTLTTTANTNVTLPVSGTLITDAVTTLSSLSSVGVVTSGTWSSNLGAVSGSALTNLTAANLTGTIPSAVLANSSAYIGSTAVALNRAAGALVLSDVSISGAAGALTTATGAVVVSSATAPTAGQVLTAINGTSAAWSSPGTTADLSNATGVLSVTHGGTGVTSSTGTVKAVLSTSPTLSTSVLTDSTSFDLINTTATTVNFAGAATTLNLGAATGTTTINNDLQVEGNITFGGGSTQLSATVINVEDPLIYMAENNPADVLDIGLFAGYTVDTTHYHTGIFRDATDKVWKMFSGITAEPVGNVLDLTGAVYDDLRIGKLTTTGINKVAITEPQDTATLTLANNSSLITVGGNSLTLNTTAQTNITLPTSGTLLSDNASVNIGTTSVALNRTSSSLSLTGVDIDGSAGGLKTTTGNVVVSGSSAPNTGYVLTATSPTTAAWQAVVAGGSGTVTSVAALTLTTSGTDVTSTVANGTTTPVITLNIPTASATNRGALSSTDWSTFNGKAGLASPTFTGTPAAPTAAADTNTTQLATTAFVVGQASSTTPVMNGTAAIGTSLKYARADHVHASDTSKAPLTSPSFTGTPTAPTATVGDNSTQIATTAFVLANSAPLASPSFTGVPLAPTQALGNNSTAIATTAFVIANSVRTGTINGVTGTLSDGLGNLRSIPQLDKTAAYTLAAADNGKNINITTGGITIPNSTFVAGDVISIYNKSDTTQTVSWSSLTAYKAGTSGTTNSPATLSARGILTIMFASATEIVISGNI